MGSTRRRFTPEYKAEAVQFVISSGQPVAEVARNLGIVEATWGRWVTKAGENGDAKEPELELSERRRVAAAVSRSAILISRSKCPVWTDMVCEL